MLKNSETRKERHRQLALFFIGNWAGKEKPYDSDAFGQEKPSTPFSGEASKNPSLKVKVQKTFSGETRGNRRVRPQPFALRNGVVWEQGTELDVRRGVEAVHHMLCGGLLPKSCARSTVCAAVLSWERPSTLFNIMQCGTMTP